MLKKITSAIIDHTGEHNKNHTKKDKLTIISYLATHHPKIFQLTQKQQQKPSLIPLSEASYMDQITS